MAIANVGTQYAVQKDATNIGGVTSQSVNLGLETRAESTSGGVYPDRAYIVAGRPSISFTSLAVQQVLDAIAIGGVDIGGLTAGFSAWAYKFAEGGTRAGAGQHRKYNMKDGILVLGNLSCQHGGDAQIVANATAKYDGSTDPIVESDSTTVPSGIVNAERFGLGPVTVGGVSLTAVRSLEVDFGIEVRAESGDGDIYPTTVYIATIAPVITLRGIDEQWLKTTNIPRGGKAGTHANTTLYLRARTDHSTYEANGTTAHIKLTAAGVAVIDPSHEASGGDPGEVGLRITCDYDGTNAPIVISTDVAIT